MLGAMRVLAHRPRLFVAWIVAALCSVALAGPPAAAIDVLGDAPGDIPGVLWSGGTLSSSVGGETVDRVWRLELVEGRIAIISLTGGSGAELGLYLFDAATRSVAFDEPLAQSAKAGGSQSLSAVLPAGTYYVDVNGRNRDRAYPFTLSVVLLGDTTPPTLAIRPAPDYAAVNGDLVLVQMLASDTLSGIATMRFRVDGGTWGEWQEAQLIASVIIPATLGTHRIEAQVTNRLGLVSLTAGTSVVYDNIAPTATRAVPRADGSTLSARPTVSYRFSEPMRAASWTNGGLVVLTRNGFPVPGTLTYDAATRTGSWVARDVLTLGEPYAVQLGAVVDRAGNVVAAEPAWVLTRQMSAKIVVDRGTATATYLGARSIYGTLQNVPIGAVVHLDQRLPGGEWTEHSTLVVAGELVRARFRPTQTAEWRLRYDGDAAHRAALSATRTFKVVPQLALQGAGGYVRQRAAGALVTIRGNVSPASSSLTLVRYRCNVSYTTCAVAASIPLVADEAGSVVYAWKATRGYWSWRLKSAAGAGLESAMTGRLRFTVR